MLSLITPGEEGWFTEVYGKDRRFVMYPCQNNKLMNFVAFIPNEAANATSADWSQHGNKATVLKAFDSFFPVAQKLLSHAPDEMKMWQLYDMEAMSTWTNDCLVLIGDAAHPFLPCKPAFHHLIAWANP